MTAERYFPDRHLSHDESVRRIRAVGDGYGKRRAVFVNEPGFYKFCIRDRTRPGTFVFRFGHITPELRTIVDALNSPVPLEEAA